MNKEEAEKHVELHVVSKLHDCSVIKKATSEYNKCFVVYYQSNEYIKNHDFNEMLVGKGPVIVDKYSGKIFETGSAYSAEYYVNAFEACGDPYGEPTNSIIISGWKEGVNSVEAIKSIKKVTGIGLKEAKSIVESVLAGESIVIEIRDLEKATSTVKHLNNQGFVSKQLWSNQC